MHGSDDTVAYRLWPPVAIGAPLLVGWLVTLFWCDPVDLGGWRVPLGWALVLLFVGWNGWSLWLFGRHETGLLPGQATQAMIEEGPYRLSATRCTSACSRSTSGWRCWHPRSGGSCCSRPRCCSSSGARSTRGAVPARAVRCAVRRLHAAGPSLAVTLNSWQRLDVIGWDLVVTAASTRTSYGESAVASGRHRVPVVGERHHGQRQGPRPPRSQVSSSHPTACRNT